MTLRTSASDDVTAEWDSKWESVSEARRYARVVLPTPGGPQKIIDGRKSDSVSFRIMPFFPTRCSCPMTSSSFCGRSMSASGRCSFIFLYFTPPVNVKRVYGDPELYQTLSGPALFGPYEACGRAL